MNGTPKLPKGTFRSQKWATKRPIPSFGGGQKGQGSRTTLHGLSLAVFLSCSSSSDCEKRLRAFADDRTRPITRTHNLRAVSPAQHAKRLGPVWPWQRARAAGRPRCHGVCGVERVQRPRGSSTMQVLMEWHIRNVQDSAFGGGMPAFFCTKLLLVQLVGARLGEVTVSLKLRADVRT